MNRMVPIIILLSLTSLHCGGGGSGTTAFAEETENSSEITGETKGVSISGAGGNVAVDAGFAGNGTTISIPTGFTAAQCKFTASPSLIEGSAISISASINTTTGEVVCKKVVRERTEVPPETKGCVASYTIICVK